MSTHKLVRNLIQGTKPSVREYAWVLRHRKELHLVFEITRAQTIWLNVQAGKLFNRYFFKDEREITLDAFLQETYDHRKEAAHE